MFMVSVVILKFRLTEQPFQKIKMDSKEHEPFGNRQESGEQGRVRLKIG